MVRHDADRSTRVNYQGRNIGQSVLITSWEVYGGNVTIVYLLLTYGVYTHKACSSDLAYFVTRNPFTPSLGRDWTYVATVHSSSHQAMTQASDQLHTTSVCSPPVLGDTRDTRNTRNARLLLLLVHV
jgi:hypothetical protein